MRIKIGAIIPALAISAILAGPVFADAVTGQANISGTANVSNAGIMFGAFNVDSPNDGSFSGLSGGTLQNLPGLPVTGPISVPDFGLFNVTSGTIHFDLTNIDPGTGTNAACQNNTVGNICTPINSPFTLTQKTATSVEIDLSIAGLAYLNTNTNDSTSMALFTTQNLVPGTITSILFDVAGSGFSDSYSATFSATPVGAVPEPASLLLMGIGLLGAGIIARKKIRS